LYGSESAAFVGTDAREERVKAAASGFDVLHFATHAIFDHNAPLYSRLLLASPGPNSKEDGLLEAWEIMQMDLTARLVVLSACETARGQIGAGEGVIGLTWALFVARVPATVVSQWRVEAASTTLLMRSFYTAMKKKRSSKAEALQRAALDVMRTPRYRHPFYWAPFILMGDWL
jgi:CHAT domain-containing protein